MAECEVDGCAGKTFAKGTCQRHYAAKIRCPVNERRFDFRRRYLSEWPIAWNDRVAFLADVGPMPGPRYRLRKVDPNKLLSKENIAWVPPLPVTITAGMDIAAYHRQSGHLRKYGLQPGQYEAMLEKQGGCCAICHRPPTKKIGREKIARLVVDHDHATGEVRGLLCCTCNTAIGHFDDSVEFLATAILYLSRSAAARRGEN